MEYADGREYVVRRPDGELQWIRAPRRREHRTSGAWVRESRRQRRFADPAIAVADDPAAEEIMVQERRLQRNLPSFPEVECLLRLYVATGEGRGAYLAAKTKMEEQDLREEQERRRRERRIIEQEEEDERRRRQRSDSRPHGSLPSSSGSSDEDPDDGFGGRPTHRPPSGGPSGSHPGPAYPNDPPRPIRRSRSPHVVVHEYTSESEHESVVLAQRVPAPVYLNHPVHRPWRYQEAHRPPRPTVEDASEDEDDKDLAPLPAEEDDFRLQRPSRQRSREVRNRSVQIDPTHNFRANNTRIVRRSPTRYGSIRGGHGADHNFDEDSDRDVHQLVRMRGGGSIPQPLTKTSSILAGVIQNTDYKTLSKSIYLYFFHISKGKVISSRKTELYITFQELGENQPPRNKDQLSDMWLVAKLQQHYSMINRRQRSAFGDLIRMKTIGFATFIRFERTVKRGADAGNFVVTAKVPAVSAGGEAVSHFLYSMKYPLMDAKMMLFFLDRLAGTTQHDAHCFYAVEIKEAFDTSKIYVLLILLILVSAGVGAAYAVVRSDPSTGIAIASFVLTCLSLILALVAAGQWLGLSKPDSFSFAYDWADNRILGSTEADKIFGPGLRDI
ncbi:hypothetical protein GJ744_010667 [Endocarpon pusillum]|uniref:Uncharacterized protein n=1 Tax=Endocarpon pusillum TaxID=364733 RepID=A0A8H7ALL8_9EURO|nr:hypothetical protein GJ744_010667 [Endocarpon pusillum]